MANWRFETRQVHARADPGPTTDARAVPIYHTAISTETSLQCNIQILDFGTTWALQSLPPRDSGPLRTAFKPFQLLTEFIE